MKKKIAVYAAAPLLALSLLGAASVSAQGWFGGQVNATPQEVASRQEQMFQEQANLLGLTEDQVKQSWSEGKTMKDLATENGITQDQLQTKMHELRQQQMTEHLNVLVDQGVITRAQADQRLQFMEKNDGQFMGKGRHQGQGMMGQGFGF